MKLSIPLLLALAVTVPAAPLVEGGDPQGRDQEPTVDFPAPGTHANRSLHLGENPQVTALREFGAPEELIAAVTEALSDPRTLRLGVTAHVTVSLPDESGELAPIAFGFGSTSPSGVPRVDSKKAAMISTAALGDAAWEAIIKDARYPDLLAKSPLRYKIGSFVETYTWSHADGWASCLKITPLANVTPEPESVESAWASYHASLEIRALSAARQQSWTACAQFLDEHRVRRMLGPRGQVVDAWLAYYVGAQKGDARRATRLAKAWIAERPRAAEMMDLIELLIVLDLKELALEALRGLRD